MNIKSQINVKVPLKSRRSLTKSVHLPISLLPGGVAVDVMPAHISDPVGLPHTVLSISVGGFVEGPLGVDGFLVTLLPSVDSFEL